jgi:hypothetical protein
MISSMYASTRRQTAASSIECSVACSFTAAAISSSERSVSLIWAFFVSLNRSTRDRELWTARSAIPVARHHMTRAAMTAAASNPATAQRNVQPPARKRKSRRS